MNISDVQGGNSDFVTSVKLQHYNLPFDKTDKTGEQENIMPVSTTVCARYTTHIFLAIFTPTSRKN